MTTLQNWKYWLLLYVAILNGIDFKAILRPWTLFLTLALTCSFDTRISFALLLRLHLYRLLDFRGHDITFRFWPYLLLPLLLRLFFIKMILFYHKFKTHLETI